MKKLETTKEFVMSAHQAACSDWKRKIEEEFPSLFEVKIGKWIKSKESEKLTMLKLFDAEFSGKTKGYGVNYQGEWVESEIDLLGVGTCWDSFSIATPTEIESMLWKEAEKRGIGKDTKIEESLTQIGYKCSNDGGFIIGYDINYDELWNLNGCIYKQGKWAKPLDPNKEIKEIISRFEKELAELKRKVK